MLRQAGLIVEDLIEYQSGAGEHSGYLTLEPPGWARDWPAEMLWIARKPWRNPTSRKREG